MVIFSISATAKASNVLVSARAEEFRRGIGRHHRRHRHDIGRHRACDADEVAVEASVTCFNHKRAWATGVESMPDGQGPLGSKSAPLNDGLKT